MTTIRNYNNFLGNDIRASDVATETTLKQVEQTLVQGIVLNPSTKINVKTDVGDLVDVSIDAANVTGSLPISISSLTITDVDTTGGGQTSDMNTNITNASIAITASSALSSDITAVGGVIVGSSLPVISTTLALESGGNLATIAGDTSSLDTKIAGQGQAAMASSMPVVIANNQSKIDINIDSISGTVADTSAGNFSFGTIRTITATNQPLNSNINYNGGTPNTGTQRIVVATTAGTGGLQTSSGVVNADTIRVTQATDVAILANIQSINGNAISTGYGDVTNAVQRFVPANDAYKEQIYTQKSNTYETDYLSTNEFGVDLLRWKIDTNSGSALNFNGDQISKNIQFRMASSLTGNSVGRTNYINNFGDNVLLIFHMNFDSMPNTSNNFFRVGLMTPNLSFGYFLELETSGNNQLAQDCIQRFRVSGGSGLVIADSSTWNQDTTKIAQGRISLYFLIRRSQTCEFGLIDPSGTYNPKHIEVLAAKDPSTQLLPLCFNIEVFGTHTNSCQMVSYHTKIQNYQNNDFKYHRSFSRFTQEITALTAGNTYCLIALRHKTSTNTKPNCFIKNFQALPTSSDFMYVAIIRNGTIAGTVSYGGVATESALEIHTATDNTNTVTGGQIVFGMIISSQNGGNDALSLTVDKYINSLIPELSTENMIVACSPLNNAQTIVACVNWFEEW